MMKKNHNNSIKIILISLLWIFMFAFLTFGYASYTSKLDINATALIDYIYEEVEISDIQISSSSSSSSISNIYKGLNTKGSITSNACGSYVIYDVTVLNKTPFLVYYTGVTPKSLSNDIGTNTNGFDVEILDAIPNVNYINGHESKTFKLKISNNCKNDDDYLNYDIDLDFSLVKYYEYTLTASKSDANIEINTSRNETFTGNGEVKANIYVGDTINYVVSGTNYRTVTGTEIMPDHDYSTNVEINEYLSITVLATPNTAMITCVDLTSGTNILAVQGSGTVEASKDHQFNCSIEDDDYYYEYKNNDYLGYSEEFTITDSNKVINISMLEKPWITGSYANSDRTVASIGTLTNYHSGYYLIELWGGTGGKDYQNKSENSKAGYIYATVYLAYNDVIYYTLGGNGENGKVLDASSGGANGGGNGPGIYPGGGGGYSAVAINTQTIDVTNINNGNVLLIAGGGGGSGSGYLPTSTPSYGPGGSGGTLSSTNTINSIGYVYYGSNGGGNAARAGGGGTTVGGAGAPNKNNQYAESGSLLKGGKSNTKGTWKNGGAGGAGYYGGGGGAGEGRPSDGSGSGGGGSSLISTVLGRCTPGNTYNGTLTGTNPSSTGGAVVIKFVRR